MKAASEIGQVLQEADKIKQGIDDLLKYVYEPGIGISFDLPKDTVLVEEKLAFQPLDYLPEISTKENTTLSLMLTESSIFVNFSPFLFFDILYPIENVILRGVQYHFLSKKLTIDILNAKAPHNAGLDGFALLPVANGIQEKTKKILSGTRIEKDKNYSPLRDVDILETIKTIIENASQL